VTPKKAEELEAIVSDLEDNVASLSDDLATLEDAETRGEERTEVSDQVRETFEQLCSNVRAFAKAARLEMALEA
jgi:hypothetical protein